MKHSTQGITLELRAREFRFTSESSPFRCSFFSKLTHGSFVAVLIFCSFLTAFGANIDGVVTTATAKYATVSSKSNVTPAPGDKVQIYFKVPGADVEVSVASGHVYEITGRNIMIQIDKATGTVAKGQLVRITSPHPLNDKVPTTATAPALATSSPPAPKPSAPSSVKGSALATTESTSPGPSPAPSVVTRSRTPQASATPAASSSQQMTDLVNPEKTIIGNWWGEHLIQFVANGVLIIDAYRAPNPTIAHWSIKGDQLTVHFSNGGPDAVVRIVSLTDQELVTTDDKGQTRRARRIRDLQAAQEKADR